MMGPLKFRKIIATDIFEKEMAKIVGPMVILFETDGSSPNYNELEIDEVFALKFHKNSKS
jgi:hypothetical protein